MKLLQYIHSWLGSKKYQKGVLTYTEAGKEKKREFCTVKELLNFYFVEHYKKVWSEPDETLPFRRFCIAIQDGKFILLAEYKGYFECRCKHTDPYVHSWIVIGYLDHDIALPLFEGDIYKYSYNKGAEK